MFGIRKVTNAHRNTQTSVTNGHKAIYCKELAALCIGHCPFLTMIDSFNVQTDKGMGRSITPISFEMISFELSYLCWSLGC